MGRAKYRVVRSEQQVRNIYGSTFTKVEYICQNRMFGLFWVNMLRTLDCSARVPNCLGSVDEVASFDNEQDAVKYITRHARLHTKLMPPDRLVVAEFDKDGSFLE